MENQKILPFIFWKFHSFLFMHRFFWNLHIICIFQFKSYFTYETFLIWALVFEKITENQKFCLFSKNFKLFYLWTDCSNIGRSYVFLNLKQTFLPNSFYLGLSFRENLRKQFFFFQNPSPYKPFKLLKKKIYIFAIVKGFKKSEGIFKFPFHFHFMRDSLWVTETFIKWQFLTLIVKK